jgi:hypothetical protein
MLIAAMIEVRDGGLFFRQVPVPKMCARVRFGAPRAWNARLSDESSCSTLLE